MELTITRNDDTSITFSRPGGYFIYASFHDQHHNFDTIICEGGLTSGRPLGYCGVHAFGFEQLCRIWHQHHQRVSVEDMPSWMAA